MADLTDEQAYELGRAWIEAGGGWAPGMLWDDFRVHAVARDPRGFTVLSRGCGWTSPGAQGGWPDLRDPATQGAALQVVRGRLDKEQVWLAYDGEAWGVYSYVPVEGPGDGLVLGHGFGPTEAHALVAAIREAP